MTYSYSIVIKELSGLKGQFVVGLGLGQLWRKLWVQLLKWWVIYINKYIYLGKKNLLYYS